MLPSGLKAQEELDFEQVVEDVFAVQEGEADYDEVYEYLFQLYAKPLNLNIATREDLLSVYLLSDRQVSNFINFRERYGPLLSIYELQFIPGFDRSAIARLLPFVMVGEAGQGQKLPFHQRMAQADQLWFMRYDVYLEPKRGDLIAADTLSGMPAHSYYPGSSGKLLSRMRISSRNDFSFGFTAEKDAGEVFAWVPQAKQYGMDFWSFHAHLEDKGRLKDLIMGDYSLRFGQGLVLGSGFSMGKGAETVQTVRFRNTGIRPYTSAAETGFFRGAAGTYSIPVYRSNLEITTFYSNSNEDGKLQTDTLTGSQYFNAIAGSGLHRTASEVAGRDKIIKRTIGSHLQFNHAANNFHAGILYMQTDFNARWQKTPHLYNLYEFSGSHNYNLSGHFDYSIGQVSLFGEAARSQSGGLGAVAGMTAYISSGVSIAWLLRNYEKNFHAFDGKAFGENTHNINEKGMYWGIKVTPLVRTTLLAYYDYFRFPWMRYRVEAPSVGYEYMLRLQHALNRHTSMFLQFREENKEINTDDVFPKVLPGIKSNFIFNFRHEVNSMVRFRTRMQSSRYRLDGKVSKGSSLAQDITCDFGKLKAVARFALFQTEDYQNRQYLYENDVLYAFSIPAYSGVGIRSYLVLRYKINRHFQCWLKAARTHFNDREEIGSGLETIEGNTRTQLKFQFMVKL